MLTLRVGDQCHRNALVTAIAKPRDFERLAKQAFQNLLVWI